MNFLAHLQPALRRVQTPAPGVILDALPREDLPIEEEVATFAAIKQGDEPDRGLRGVLDVTDELLGHCAPAASFPCGPTM